MGDAKPKPTRRVLKTQRIVLKKSTTLRHKSSSLHGASTPVLFPARLGAVIKVLLLDVPLATLFLLFFGTNALLYLNYKVWFPRMAQNQWTEARAAQTGQTYHRKETICEASSVITAKEYEELLIPAAPSNDVSTQDGAEIIRKHGAGLLSNILTNEADMEAFREFSLQKNHRLGNDDNGSVDVVGVIENGHRWSFAFEVNEHPSIGRLLIEIGKHKELKACLEDLLGPNPSIIELSTITAEHGAKAQGWHFDTSDKGDSIKYANTFSDLYSLLIPVQTTTAEMGATAVCPGTHYCPQFTGCDEVGFQAVDNNGVWAAGDGFLFNSHVAHQVMAHTKGPPRVAIVISFVSRPSKKKLLPLAAGYVIPWNTMGFNFEDLEKAPTTMVPPWSTLRSLGLTKIFDSKNDRQNAGWDYFGFCESHMANFDDPPQVVLMPYIKLLPLFLLGQAHHHPIYSPWQAFVIDTLQNIWVFSLVLYVVGLTMYLQILGAFDDGAESKNILLSTRSLWTRLLASHGLALMIVLVIAQHYVGEYHGSIAISHEARSTHEL